MKRFPKFNGRQADLIVERMRGMLGPDISDMLDSLNINPNHLVRFRYIADLCKSTREQKSLSLKEVSSRVKVPQYRLKAIEGSSISEIILDDLEEYIRFLDLEDTFSNWTKENQDVYASIAKQNKYI
jgi:hypothetical protein